MKEIDKFKIYFLLFCMIYTLHEDLAFLSLNKF
jgi:hypothetical protein